MTSVSAFGNAAGGFSFPWGKFAMIRLFDRALDSTELLSLMKYDKMTMDDPSVDAADREVSA